MPRHCSAVGCKSRDTTEVRKFGITFHRLPKKGNPRRTSWIINSCRKGPGGKGQWDPQSHFIYFCSKHFTPDSFELSGVSGYRRLKDDAIPTVFEIQPHERGTARRGTAKRSCRPQNVKNHISVKNFTNNKDSENQEIFNSERMLQKIPDDADASSSEQDKGEKNQGQPPPQPSSEAAHTPVDDLPDPSFPQRPPSPSCYMKRLPPPPGFYLPKEHSYAQRCPLEWRKRYDKAIDSLEKTLQLLSAARRRENRLRNALFRLRENRIKSTLFRSQDGLKGKQDKGGRFSSWAAQKGQATKEKRDGGLESLEENSNEGAAVDIDDLKEGWHSQVQTRAKVLMEDEEGFCFYCGRNNDGNKVIGYNEAALRPDEVQGVLIRCRPKGLKEVKNKVMVPKALRGQRPERNTVPPVEHQSYYLYYCESDENEDTMQVVAMEMQPHKLIAEDEASGDLQAHTGTVQQFAVLHPETEMQMLDTVPGPVQYSTSAQFQLQVLHQHQGLVLPNTDIKEKSELEIDPRGEKQQFYLVQEKNDDHVLLTSVPTETSERGKVGSINEIVQHQSVLENFQLRVTEERDALPVKCDLLATMGWGNSQVTHQPNQRPKIVGGDVRERLKEHLEGFQLQLSSEFID